MKHIIGGILFGLMLVASMGVFALDLQPGESHTSTVNCMFGDGSCPPKPFGTHGGLHKQNVKDSGLAHCASCHDHDFFSRNVSVEGVRGCIAPTGNFRPYTQATGPVDERWCEAEPGKLLQVIGSDSACMNTDDVAACLMCHGRRFAGRNMDDNGHQNWTADNGAKLLPCAACHNGNPEGPDDGECREPHGDSPGDKHCQQDLTCSNCHASCDKLLSKCEDED